MKYIFTFIRRNKNDSSKTIIKRKNKENNKNQNKQSIKNTDTKNIIIIYNERTKIHDNSVE